MSILRTSKFVRYIGSLARNIVFNNSRNTDGLLIKRQNLFCAQNYATAAATATAQHQENSIDRSIRRLDEDARRIGRISRRELEDVIEEIKSNRSATSSQSLMVIRCYGNLVPEETPEFRTELVKNVWRTLEKLGIPMDISHYNALLRVYLENEHKFSPTEFLGELEKKGIEPNRVTYQRLIAGYCQRGDIDGATQILEFMREKQMPISEGVFNALILGHSKAGDMKSARGILSVMGQAGLEPSSDTYSALLCGYASMGDSESLEATFQECVKRDIYLADRDYLEIVYTLAINNHDNLVDSVLKNVHRSSGYNQDAANVILRLTTHGKENVAYKILESMPSPLKGDGQPAPSGTFFIKQLVKSNRPTESILNVCGQLKENGLNSRGLLIATEVALQIGNFDLALDLFRAMQNEFYPIRNHYFWPLIVNKGEKNTEGVLEVLKKMSEFKIIPSTETIKDYVLPFLIKNDNVNNPDKVISDLQRCNVSVGVSASALVGYLLFKNKLKEAANIASSYRANYSAAATKPAIISAFLNSSDADSFAKLINALIQGRQFGQRDEEELEEDSGYDDREFVGRMLLSIVNKKRSIKLTELLQKMLDSGLGISNSAAEQIQAQLSGEELTSEVSDLLSQLVSSDLSPVPLQRRSIKFLPKNEQSLRNYIEKLKGKGDPALNLKKQLFSLLCQNKDLAKVLEYCKELEAENITLTSGMHALLIELYLYHKDLDSALKEYEALMQKEPDCKLDNIKTIRLACGLAEAGRVDDVVEFLKKQSREDSDIDKEREREKPFLYSSVCWRLLNTLAEKGDTQGVRRVFDSLIENKFIEVNNALLGPLVKAHLVKDDLKGALEVYEWCCQHYRATPFKNELACKLIQKEDAAELQRLTDLSTVVHGEINSLHDLIIAFVECGRIRQARKILETPGLRVRPDKITYAGERYQNEGLVEPLEALVKATKDITQVDRASLYYQLLLSYKKADDVEKAIGLWTQMQEEDVQPTDEFLYELGKYIESKNEPVPFTIPENPSSATKVSEAVSSNHRNLQRALTAKNWSEALNEYNLLRKLNAKIYPTEVSGFLELALNTVGAIKTLPFVKDLLINKIVIPNYKLYYFTKILAKTGDLETFKDFQNYLTDEQILKSRYKNLLCNAYIISGKTQELLKEWENKIYSAKDKTELEKLIQDFPHGGLFALLEAEPDLLSRVEKIAEKLAENGITNVANVLWMYYLVKNESEKTEEIFNKYLKSADGLMFRYVQNYARNELDDSKIDELIKYVKKLDKTTDRQIGIIHSAKVDILVNKQEPEKALEYLQGALKDVSLDYFNFTSLNRLKNSLASINKELPFKIQKPKHQKSTVDNETSDSDNEEASVKHRRQ